MIKLTNHYIARYKERISKSRKEAQSMADKAFEFGTDLEKIQDCKLKKELKRSDRSNEPWI